MTVLRRKTIVSRARIRVSPQPSDSDDVSGGSGFKGDDGTRHQIPEALEKDNNGGDGRREKCPIVGDNEAGNGVDQLKSDACIVCGGEDNQVLVCHEPGCPVSIHHSCMPDEPDFDELGNFYCPYCWYKRLVVKSLKLQEKVMAAEKCVKAREASLGLDMAVTVDKDGEETRNVIEVNMSLGRMKGLNPCENRGVDGESGHRRVELEKNQQMETVAAEIRDPEVSNNDESAQGQDSDEGEGRKRRRKSSDRRERVEEEKYGDQSHRTEDKERECGADLKKYNEVVKEQENGLRKHEEAKPDHPPSISSPISTDSVDESDTSDQEFALVMRSKGNVQDHHDASSSKKPLFQPEQFSRGDKTYQEKNATASHDPKQRKDIRRSDRKRKRLFWTPEEEEMLEVAVEKFSRTANKNMPWRKVLEFGQNVFQEGRTPADLKDKWKKMTKVS